MCAGLSFSRCFGLEISKKKSPKYHFKEPGLWICFNTVKTETAGGNIISPLYNVMLCWETFISGIYVHVPLTCSIHKTIATDQVHPDTQRVPKSGDIDKAAQKQSVRCISAQTSQILWSPSNEGPEESRDLVHPQRTWIPDGSQQVDSIACFQIIHSLLKIHFRLEDVCCYGYSEKMGC